MFIDKKKKKVTVTISEKSGFENDLFFSCSIHIKYPVLLKYEEVIK